jgi:hypothetical protein
MSAPCPTLGFPLAFTIGARVSESGRQALHRAFLETVAASGLVAEPCGEAEDGYTITGDGTQATESDRERLLAWLGKQHEVADYRAGPLCDLSERR